MCTYKCYHQEIVGFDTIISIISKEIAFAQALTAIWE
jgi:hypothetical protein